jgi:hypothetical protein
MPIPAGLGGPELPEWAPTNEQVADYVPHRTLSLVPAGITEGDDTYKYVFDQDTRPTGIQVDRLIGNAVAWVSARLAPMHESVQAAAGVAATLMAAASVERSWPNDDQSLQRANDMEKRLDVLMADLITANDTANRPGQEDGGGFDVLPVWSFDQPDRRFSDSRYF